MAPQTARSKRQRQATDPPTAAREPTLRQRIENLHAERNLDAVRDEALSLAGQLELTKNHVETLATTQYALRGKLEALTAYEHYAVVITGVERNGRRVVEVAGLGGTRVQVQVHPEVDSEKLRVGATGMVAREKNCLLNVTAMTGRWNAVGSFERYLDSPARMLVRDRDSLLAVDVADALRGTPLSKGDLIGFDPEVAAMAYVRLEPPQADHLFDEDVTDDFSQLGGLDREIAQIKQHIDFRFRFADLAAKYSLSRKCGVLLNGAPGNGKTRFARCTAAYGQQLSPDRPCRFMHVAGSSDYSKWFGETEHFIMERFNAIRDAAADGLVIVFWDEVDALAKRRGTDYGSGAPDRILSTFLSQIDGVVPLDNVLLMYATNRADTLDPALLRAGRTDLKIDIPTPNRRATEAILHCYLNRGLPLASEYECLDQLVTPLLSQLFAPNGRYAEVAQVKLNDGRQLPVAGRQLISGAMLENVVNVAAQQAAVREAETGQEGLIEEDLDLALGAELKGTVSLLAPGNVKSYVQAIPQDALPIAVEPLLTPSTSSYIRTN